MGEITKPETTKLEFAHKMRAFHHASLWEEEKHFTWLCTLLLSFEGYLFILEKPFAGKLALLVVTSLFGILLSIIAFKVVRTEGEYFNKNLKHFVAEYNFVFAERPLPDAPEKSNKDIATLIGNFVRNEQLGGRDAFQIVFLGFIAAFFAFLLISVWRFWCPAGGS